MPGSKPLLVCMHGALENSAYLAPITLISSQYFRVIAPDFLGHGAAVREHPNEYPHSIYRLALQIESILEKEGEAYLLGYSLGGYVALLLAQKKHPKVKGVATCSTKLDWNDQILEKQKNSLHQLMSDPEHSASKRLFAEHGENWQKLVQANLDLMSELPSISIAFSEIEVPTLMATGDKDRFATPLETYEAFSKLQNGALLILPNSKHSFHQLRHLTFLTETIHFWGIE